MSGMGEMRSESPGTYRRRATSIQGHRRTMFSLIDQETSRRGGLVNVEVLTDKEISGGAIGSGDSFFKTTYLAIFGNKWRRC